MPSLSDLPETMIETKIVDPKDDTREYIVSTILIKGKCYETHIFDHENNVMGEKITTFEFSEAGRAHALKLTRLTTYLSTY